MRTLTSTRKAPMRQGDTICPMCGWMMEWGWGMMMLFALFCVAVIALVGWLIYRLMKGRHSSSGSTGSPENVLKERYARGEIDLDTYQRMRGDLKGGDR